MLLRMIRDILKCFATGLDAFLSSLPYVTKGVLKIGLLVVSMFAYVEYKLCSR